MNVPPESVTSLFPESLNLSPRQQEVLSLLQTYPEGALAADIAKHFNMHVNTVRGHLEELVNAGSVTTVSAPSTGRGRPSLIYRAQTPDNRTVANEYITLMNVLVEDADLTPEQARDVGRKWARVLRTRNGRVPTSGSPLQKLLPLLRDMGFSPETEGESKIRLHACPFVGPSGEMPSPAICAIHAGFVAESAGTNERTAVIPLAASGECHVLFNEQEN